MRTNKQTNPIELTNETRQFFPNLKTLSIFNNQNDLFKEDFKNAANYAENIYNKILIINSFCSDKKYSTKNYCKKQWWKRNCV